MIPTSQTPPPQILLLLVLGACGPDVPAGGQTDSDATTNSSTGSGTSPEPTTGLWPDPDQRIPQESPWEVVVDALPFPLSGPGQIHTLTVGRVEFNENFANRGHIEVLFDHPEETITIESRKYVFGDLADTYTFEKLSLLAVVLDGDPLRSIDIDPADNCLKNTWQNDCSIYAYYDGKSQPERTAVDIRVHLPAGYRGQLFAETEDNIAEQSHPRRGGITLDNFCGSGAVTLESGRANVRMCRDLSPAPTCALADAQACAEYPDGGGSEAWSPDCPCPPESRGQLEIRSPIPLPTDITLDIPDTAPYVHVSMANLADAPEQACTPEITNCAPGSCLLDASDPFAPTAEFNHPSPAAAGYTIILDSGGCGLIKFAGAAEDWSETLPPAEELRGRITLCTDCL